MRTTTLIANRNYQEFLPNAIDSFLKQTYDKNLSKLCLVDASDDFESVKKIWEEFFGNENYSSTYAEKGIVHSDNNNILIHLYPKDNNVYPSTLRNIGIEATIKNTDVFFILDADDKMLPRKIERMVEVISEYPDEIGVVYADHYTTNYITKNVSIEYREPYSKRKLLEACIVHSNAAVTSSALLAVKDEYGFYDCTMRTCEDYDLWMRISKKYMIVHISEILSDVLVQPKNSTASVNKEIWERNWRRVHEKNGKKI